MKERLEEAESMGVRRMKAQVQAMEGRVSSLEEQLDAATRYEEEWEEGREIDMNVHVHAHTFVQLSFFLRIWLSCICYMCRHLGGKRLL